MPWVKSSRAGLLSIMTIQTLALAACIQDDGGTATKPIPREEFYWRKLHDSYVDRAKQKEIDLLFLGDSITQGWNDNDTWKRNYQPRKASNMGIGGDRTEHVLWRLENGTVEGLSPRVVVLMIGTNNIGSNTPAQIAAGIRRIVQLLHEKLPTTRVLVLGVFPRGSTRAEGLTEELPDPRPGQINALIETVADGKTVFYQDISKVFLNEKGAIPKDLMPDFLHLSAAGYDRWADAIEPTLWKLLEDDRNVKQP
jgi:beta-glucosidase